MRALSQYAVGVGRRLGGGLALSVAGTRKVCPDGAGSCGDPFRRSEVCIDSSERQRVEQLTSVGSLNLVSQ